ncbi:MAG: polysaccharide biosynthesis/export family protein [Gammaproteobacteria bacterium]
MGAKPRFLMGNPVNNWHRITNNTWQRHVRLYGFFIAALAIAGCATQVVTPPTETGDLTDGSSADMNSFNEYRLRSGDVLEIMYQIQTKEISAYTLNIQDVVELRFVSLPHLNLVQAIRVDGLLTMPLVGDVRVLGLTPAAATEKIRKAYEGVLRDPDVFLLVKEFGAATKELKNVITNWERGQSKLLTIRPDGAITFPIIGDMDVASRTIPELSESVNAEYQKIYPELQVDVILFEITDRFLYVFGEVNKPGAFEILHPITLGQSLALAGGTNSKSRITDIIVARHSGQELIIRRFDYKSVLEGKHSMIQVALQPDDIVYVPRRPLSSDSEISQEIGRLLLFGGYSVNIRSY